MISNEVVKGVFMKRKYQILIISIAVLGSLLLLIYSMWCRYSEERYFDSVYEGLFDTNKEKSDFNYKIFIVSGSKSCGYLVRKLTIEKDSIRRAIVINLIAYRGCSNYAEQLLPFMNDADCKVRAMTIDALGFLGYEKFSSLAVETIRNDPDKIMKIYAIRTLAEFGNVEDVVFLEDLAVNEFKDDEQLRKAIKLALERRQSKIEK